MCTGVLIFLRKYLVFNMSSQYQGDLLITRNNEYLIKRVLAFVFVGGHSCSFSLFFLSTTTRTTQLKYFSTRVLLYPNTILNE